MIGVWDSKVPCSQSVLNFGYMSKVSDSIEPKEVLVLCPIWDFSRSCGMQAGTNCGPYQSR